MRSATSVPAGPSSSAAAAARSCAESGTPSAASTRSPPQPGLGGRPSGGWWRSAPPAAAGGQPQAEPGLADPPRPRPPSPPPGHVAAIGVEVVEQLLEGAAQHAFASRPGGSQATPARRRRTCRTARPPAAAPRPRAAAGGQAGIGRAESSRSPAPRAAACRSAARIAGRAPAPRGRAGSRGRAGPGGPGPDAAPAPRRARWRAPPAPVRAGRRPPARRRRGREEQQQQQGQERATAFAGPAWRLALRGRAGGPGGMPCIRWKTMPPVRGVASTSRASTAWPRVKAIPVRRPDSALPGLVLDPSVVRQGRERNNSAGAIRLYGDEQAEPCHPRNACVEHLSDPLRHVCRKVAVDGVAFGGRGAALGLGDVLARIGEARRLGLPQPVRRRGRSGRAPARGAPAGRRSGGSGW